MDPSLSPAHQIAFDQLMHVLPLFPVVGVAAGSGAGKTTILRKMQGRTGGSWISVLELIQALRTRHPLSIEETFEELIATALKTSDHVYVDDISLLSMVVQGGCGGYPRPNFLASAFESLTRLAETHKKKLIYASLYQLYDLSKKGYLGYIPAFTATDYEYFSRAYLGAELAARLDHKKIFRYARSLQGYDLKAVALIVRNDAQLDTERYIEALRTFGLTSNVNLGDVQPVTLANLKGVDDVVRSLEANVIVPLEQVELADELKLRAKRGVLLVGPPGTGKTTVGRALAHRLKSKFFLIDGTCISGTSDFYYRIQRVFDEAKHNAPSIIFVDDSDAIFESGEELGLYRYLLTMLDGLESESVGQVCVMMTAMDVGHLPPALIRSGRVELWLEMRLPDEAARASILEQIFEAQPAPFAAVNISQLVDATPGFTGADLKRLVDDGKNLLAYDSVQGIPLQPVTEYFLRAVATVSENKQRYADAEARARAMRPARPVYYDSPVASP